VNLARLPWLLVMLVWIPMTWAANPSSYSVESPDKRIEVRVRNGERIRYDVLYKGKPVLQDSQISMDIEHKTLGANAKVLASKQRSSDKWWEPAVRQKFAKIHDNYNELRLELDDQCAVVFRAYNEGAAYRFETSIAQDQVHVYSEEGLFRFAADYAVYYPQEESFFSHNERKYLPQQMSTIVPAAIATLPAVVDLGDGVKLALAESDLEEYPGLWLKGTSGKAIAATFPPYPLKEQLERDRDYKVVESTDYIAITKGTRTFPWRVVGIAEKDSYLVTNELVWLLESPSRVQDTSWIKPGKVAWDWWNANNVYGVDFKAGLNTDTYKYYIDFAAKYAIPYIILDEGWYKLGNVLSVVPEINMEELTEYAKQKNVGIILWVVWKTLEDQMTPALDQFAKWGVKGIKVDFMQRSDQVLIRYYHRVSEESAKRKLLVDFHGDQKPAVMTRTWPNLISTEGVRGLEWLKWSNETDPPHEVTLPFTRMFLGPMDFTPGAMLNAQKANFAPIHNRPMSLGTRCQQLAMYVVYESPLQMLADSPSNYLREPEAMEFLAAVPTEWDDTRALDGKIGEYIVVARRSSKDWYMGAMTNWSARELQVDLSFLADGNYTMDTYQDGENANHQGSDYRVTKSQATKSSKIMIRMAPGGGWVARIHP